MIYNYSQNVHEVKANIKEVRWIKILPEYFMYYCSMIQNMMFMLLLRSAFLDLNGKMVGKKILVFLVKTSIL